MRSIGRAAGIVVAAAAFASAPPAAAAGRTHQVAIKALSYEPPALAVKRGDVVVWTNQDPFPHTVTASGKFDSKEIKPGESWSYKAQQSGDVPYICSLHPTMKATLRVK